MANKRVTFTFTVIDNLSTSPYLEEKLKVIEQDLETHGIFSYTDDNGHDIEFDGVTDVRMKVEDAS